MLLKIVGQISIPRVRILLTNQIRTPNGLTQRKLMHKVARWEIDPRSRLTFANKLPFCPALSW